MRWVRVRVRVIVVITVNHFKLEPNDGKLASGDVGWEVENERRRKG